MENISLVWYLYTSKYQNLKNMHIYLLAFLNPYFLDIWKKSGKSKAISPEKPLLGEVS